tara:strand:+ start:25 stop:480 length:456 start_codon:yes stop_codon:yes gene_type:complete
MAVINIIKATATEVGITATVTDSDAKLQVQLNRLKDHANDPMALITWDLTTSLTFDVNGFLQNPTTPVTMLLMSKANSTEKVDREAKAEEMGDLFTIFIQSLRNNLIQYNRNFDNSNLITGIAYQLVPMYGLGKHSGVIGRFTMISGIMNC